ncbi:MAG: hypothetical protein R3C46_11285 [Hyphomonadaceae bacterium]
MPVEVRPPKTLASRIIGWRPKLEVAALISGIVASTLSIVGILVWIDEKNDRDDDRKARAEEREAREKDAEARRISLIGQAYAAISQEAADGDFDTGESGLTRWALDTLQREGEPIRIVADTVRISGVDFTCATLRINAKTIGISDVVIRNSNLDLDVEGPMDAWFIRSGLLGTYVSVSWTGPDGARPEEPLSIGGSELDDVSFIQYRQTTKAGSKDKLYRQDDGVDVAIFESRGRDLTMHIKGEFTRVPFVGPDTLFRMPGAVCKKKDQNIDCPSAGTDLPAVDAGGRRLVIPMEKPDCEQPNPIMIGLRFNKLDEQDRK